MQLTLLKEYQVSKRKQSKRPVSKRPSLGEIVQSEIAKALQTLSGHAKPVEVPVSVPETKQDTLLAEAKQAVSKPVQGADRMASVRAAKAEHDKAVQRLRDLGVLPEDGMVNAFMREIIEALMRDAAKQGSPILGIPEILKASFKLGTIEQRISVLEKAFSGLVPALISQVTVATRGVQRLKTRTTRLTRTATPIAAKAVAAQDRVDRDLDNTDWLKE